MIELWCSLHPSLFLLLSLSLSLFVSPSPLLFLELVLRFMLSQEHFEHLLHSEENASLCICGNTCHPLPHIPHPCICTPVQYIRFLFPSVVTCENPGNPQHGTINLNSSQLEFNKSVTFNCDPGYTLLGESQLVCKANGSMSGKRPTCQGNLYLITNAFWINISFLEFSDNIRTGSWTRRKNTAQLRWGILLITVGCFNHQDPNQQQELVQILAFHQAITSVSTSRWPSLLESTSTQRPTATRWIINHSVKSSLLWGSFLIKLFPFFPTIWLITESSSDEYKHSAPCRESNQGLPHASRTP